MFGFLFGFRVSVLGGFGFGGFLCVCNYTYYETALLTLPTAYLQSGVAAVFHSPTKDRGNKVGSFELQA